MKIYKTILLTFASLFFLDMKAIKYPSSYPFIAGSTFWNFCDFVIDENIKFDPSKVKTGNTILLQAHLFQTFFDSYHPKISQSYILVTANCGINADDPIPGPFKSYLNDEKIIAWFTQNVDCKHPKLHPMPIGLANQGWEHGNVQTFDHYIKTKDSYSRSKLLYLNFSIGTYPLERQYVYDLFATMPFCTVASKRSLSQYLIDLAGHKFNISPRGNGLDCHRTWESLLMGCIPIVKSSLLDELFEDLPVVIINDWKEVTEEFLHRKYEELYGKTYTLEKIYAQYWFDQIKSIQADFIKKQKNNSKKGN